MEQFVNIELLGQKYTFKADVDVSRAKEVANFVEMEVARVETQMSKESTVITPQMILILVALNIASEYVEIRKRYMDLLTNISEKTSGLINIMDNCLHGASCNSPLPCS